jgi:hypothetical protein
MTVFDYGVVSAGPISLSGNAQITGGTKAHRPAIFSELSGDPNAIELSGNARLAGDVYSVSPTDDVTLSGNTSIGGLRPKQMSSLADQHIHLNQAVLALPSLNVAAFEALATNVIDANSATHGNMTLQNIRIAAGTNPVFSGNVNLRGLVLIESPNVVRFEGNVNLVGMIVGENAADDPSGADSISFAGNVRSRGVQALPNKAPFKQIRKMGGSMLIAPDFDVSFQGNTKINNGTIAVDSLSFTGNTRAKVDGSVLIYGNTQFDLHGNTRLLIEHGPNQGMPPGLGASVPEPASLLVTALGALAALRARRRRNG